MRGAAQIVETQFGIPYEVFGELTGLEAVDKFLQALADISGTSVPEKYERQRPRGGKLGLRRVQKSPRFVETGGF